MEENLKKFIFKGAILVALIFLITFVFRFPIEYFGLKMFGMNSATTLFSKSDALKIFALAILFFALYYKETISGIIHKNNKFVHTSAFIILGIATVTGYYFFKYLANANNIESGSSFYFIQIASAILLVCAFSFFTIAVFSLEYLQQLYSKLTKPLWITFVATISAYFLLMGFQNLWPYFSYSISIILFGLFNPLYPTYLELGRIPLLDVNGFAVSIGASCCGIESLFLFIVFSIGIYTLDHKRLKKKTFFISSLIGLIGIYFVNIIRLFLLILTGIYTSPQFAIGIFHTNVGWILFVIYFLAYYFFTKNFVYKQVTKNGKTSNFLAR
jgi:exosortase/archaeosortase family protein